MKILVRLVVLLSTVASVFTVYSKQIDVASGWDKPPYVISKGNTGFEIELVKSILATSGHRANMLYVPMGRAIRMVGDKKVDIALSMNQRQPVPTEWLSDVYVVYQNVVITRQDRNKKIGSLSDLKNMTVLGFQTANQALGEAFSEVVSTHPGYLELADQQRQVSMLLLGSVDAIVMDYHIFEHFRDQMPEHQQADVTYHHLFADSPYRAVIPDPVIRTAFNSGLRKLRENGTYSQLAQQFMLAQIITSYATVL